MFVILEASRETKTSRPSALRLPLFALDIEEAALVESQPICSSRLQCFGKRSDCAGFLRKKLAVQFKSSIDRASRPF
jgi:hypothetical protein